MPTQKKITKTARRVGEITEKYCRGCKKVRPIEDFYLYKRVAPTGELREYRKARCKDCYAIERKRYPTNTHSTTTADGEKIHPAVYRPEGISCRENCENYPCFRGIDNLSSNLARTCLKFKMKDNQAK